MKLRLLAAGIALALGGGHAAATVITPGTAGGSELVFFISDITAPDTGDAIGGSTSYSQDLGITMSQFNPTQSYAFQLSSAFNIYKDPSRYDPTFLSSAPLIQGVAPDFGPPRPAPFSSGIFHLNWGVQAADSNAGSLMTTYAAFNDQNVFDPLIAPTVTNAQVAASANRLNEAWTADGTNDRHELNTLPGHLGPGNGSQLLKLDDFLNDPNDTTSGIINDPAILAYTNGATNYYMGTDVLLTGAGEPILNPRAELFELVPMYLFTQSGGTDADATIQGDGTDVGLWYIDFENNWLVYEFPGSPVPAPVPVPAAVWLLGSALLGMVGISRRRAAA